MSASKKIVVGVLLCSVVFWVGDKISLSVRTAFNSGAQFFGQDTDLLGLITTPFSSLERLLEFSVHKTDLMVGGVAVLIVGMIALYRMANRKEFRPGEEHGSASWGKPGDISSVMDKDPQANLWLSKTEGIALDGRKTQRNLNVLVIGSSGSGNHATTLSQTWLMPICPTSLPIPRVLFWMKWASTLSKTVTRSVA